MPLARQYLFISIASEQTLSGRSNSGTLLAGQHLFISLGSAQTESGWSNLGILLARQHLFISLASAQRDLSFMVNGAKFVKSVEFQSRIHMLN